MGSACGRRIVEMVWEEQTPEKIVTEAAWTPSAPRFERGWGWLYSRHVTQADKGCDFDFLETGFGQTVGEPDIY